MKNGEIKEKVRRAYTHAAPDVLETVLSDCREEQKGNVTAMTTTKKNSTWGKRLVGLAACLCLLAGGES